jgi:hypothetical protein
VTSGFWVTIGGLLAELAGAVSIGAGFSAGGRSKPIIAAEEAQVVRMARTGDNGFFDHFIILPRLQLSSHSALIPERRLEAVFFAEPEREVFRRVAIFLSVAARLMRSESSCGPAANYHRKRAVRWQQIRERDLSRHGHRQRRWI